jgi:2,5-diamino-6-(ribosylamino)-4(3H)-pyrimidinone 5'-phosphate reductase
MLKQFGVNSLMVEGGATVIAAFLSLRDHNNESLVDMHIVTVAPTIVGSAGVQAIALIKQESIQ